MHAQNQLIMWHSWILSLICFEIIDALRHFIVFLAQKKASFLYAPLQPLWPMLMQTGHRKPRKALVVQAPWARLILKSWELRGRQCCYRGRFCIAEAGTGKLVGEAALMDCLHVGTKNQRLAWAPPPIGPQNFAGLPKNLPKHCVTNLNLLNYHQLWAWVIPDAIPYQRPRPYKHPAGAVQWVCLPSSKRGPAMKRRSQPSAKGSKEGKKALKPKKKRSHRRNAWFWKARNSREMDLAASRNYLVVSPHWRREAKRLAANNPLKRSRICA